MENSFLKEIIIESRSVLCKITFIAMNSLLMKEVLKENVDRNDFCDLVGPEVI